MQWYFALPIGLLLGFFLAAILRSGKVADLYAQIWDLEQQLMRAREYRQAAE